MAIIRRRSQLIKLQIDPNKPTIQSATLSPADNTFAVNLDMIPSVVVETPARVVLSVVDAIPTWSLNKTGGVVVEADVGIGVGKIIPAPCKPSKNAR